MIHYAVTAGEYSCYHIISICEDRQKAENLAKIYGGEVEEYDDGSVMDDLQWYMFIPEWEWQCRLMEYPFRDWKPEPYKNSPAYVYLNEADRVAWFVYGRHYIHVRAKNKETALKAAQDIYAEVKAKEYLVW